MKKGFLLQCIMLTILMTLCLSFALPLSTLATEMISPGGISSENVVSKTTNSTGATGAITWTLDRNTGILTLSGTGATDSYSGADQQPWYNYRSEIVKVIVKEGVTKLGDRLFYYSDGSALKEVELPKNSLTEIGVGTFRGCSSLKEITLPDSLTNLGRVAFYKCTSLQKVVLGSKNSKLTTLRDQTFAFCKNLKEIHFPASITTLKIKSDTGAGPFSNTTPGTIYYTGSITQWKALLIGTNSDDLQLNSISVICSDGTFTYGVTSGYNQYTGNCGNNLTYHYDSNTGKLTISGTGDMYDYSSDINPPWSNIMDKIKTLVIENGVTSVGAYAFRKAGSLSSVTLPEGLRSLGAYSFGSCTSLTGITLPEGLKVIGAKAFSSTSNLKTIYLPGTITNIDLKAFESSGLRDVYYNGTKGHWSQIIISTSARGNNNLLAAKLHLQQTEQSFSDISGSSGYRSAVTYLTDNGYLKVTTNTYNVNNTADMDMVLEALYQRAGTPGMYASMRVWAVNNSLVSSAVNKSLTLGDLAYTLYRTAIYNGTIKENDGKSPMEWCTQQQYFSGLTNTNDTTRELTRGEASLVLAAYLQSSASSANRKAELIETIKNALAKGGDGKMYIYVPDMSVEYASSKPGDCTLIVFPNGKIMMIDSGIGTGKSIVLGMLEELGITYVDYLVLSHPHIDHVGNMVAVVNHLQTKGEGIGTFYWNGYDYNTYTQQVINALNNTTQVKTLIDGDVFHVGDVKIQIFNPTKDGLATMQSGADASDKNVNNISLTMKFTYGTSTYLTGGDLYINQENILITKNGSALRADIIKANHHGAYTSNSEEWLATVNPVITFAETDDIGSSFLAESCAKKGIAFYSFGLDGSILISMDNARNYEVITQKDSIIRSSYTGQIGKKDGLIEQSQIVIDTVKEVAFGSAPFTIKVSGGAEELPYLFSSSDPSVLTVDADGKVQIVGVGTAVITVTKTKEYYRTVSAEVTITVKETSSEIQTPNGSTGNGSTDSDGNLNTDTDTGTNPDTDQNTNTGNDTDTNTGTNNDVTGSTQHAGTSTPSVGLKIAIIIGSIIGVAALAVVAFLLKKKFDMRKNQ